MKKVSVLKCSSYDTGKIYKVIKESLKNIDFEVPKNKKILLKPNVLGQYRPELSITTNPAILDSICKLLKENNNEIWIGDSGGVGSPGGTRLGFKITGIEAVAKKYNARLIPFEGSEKREIIDNNAKVIKRFIIAKEPSMVDLIINVPKLKTHVLMKYTGAVKNMFGCVPGGGKPAKHALAPNEDMFGNLIIDIYKNVTPHLNIMDAIIGLEGNAPGTGGNPRETGLILVSEDAVALDIEASRIIGFDPLEIKTIKYAIERGIFTNIEDVKVIGEVNQKEIYKKRMQKITLSSKIPESLASIMFNLTSIKPYIEKDKCKKCNACAKACPVSAIGLNPYPKFNRKKCILCYCCHEICPYNAIELDYNHFIRAYKIIRDKKFFLINRRGTRK